MANEIVLKLKVDKDGSLKATIAETEKLAASIKKASGATEEATTKKNYYNKTEKGTAGVTSNSTKEFSKQAQAIGSGLVPAYATLAANVFAVTAAYGALSRAAGLEQLQAGLEYVGNAAGQNLPYIAQQLRNITGEAISTKAAMESVALGTSAGFSTEQMEDLTRVAKGASLALGRDMGDAMDRLVRGATKLEPEILDELGIMVRLDDATEAYAETLGKSNESLTQFERRMAFTNAIIEQGTEKFGAIAEAIDPNPYNQLAASFADLSKSGLNVINAVLEPIVTLFANSKVALAGGVTLFASSLSRQMVPALYQGAEAAAEEAIAIEESAKQKLANLATTDKLPAGYRKVEEAIRTGIATDKEYQAGVTSLNRAIAARQNQLTGLYSVERAGTAVNAQKVAELEQLKKIKTDILKVEAATLASEAKNLEAETIRTASIIKYRETFRGLKSSIDTMRDAHYANVTATGANISALNRLMVTAKAGAITFRVLGSAILNAIPIIGTIIMAVGLLYEGYQKLTDAGPVVNATDEVIKSFESFNTISSQLNSTLEGVTDTTTIYVSTLNAASGIIDQIASGISKISAAENKQKMEDYIAAQKEVEELSKRLTSEEIAALQSGGEAAQAVINRHISMFSGNVAYAYKLAYHEAENLKDSLNELSDTAAQQVQRTIAEAMTRIGTNDKLEQYLAPQLKMLSDLQDEIAGGSRVADLDKQLSAISSEITLVSNIFKTASKDVAGFNTAMSELSQKATKGPFNDAIDNLDKLVDKANSLKDPKQMKAFVDTLDKSFVDRINSISQEGSFLDNLQEYVSTFKDWNDKVLLVKSAVKELEAASKSAKQYIEFSPEAANDYYNLQNQIYSKRIDALNAEKSALVEAGQNEDRIKEINQEILSFKERILDTDQIANKELDARSNLSSKVLTQEQKTSKTILDRINAQIEFAKAEAQLSKLQSSPGSGELSPREELELFKQLKADRLDAISQESAIRKQSIDAEYDLLEARFQLLQAEYTKGGYALDPKIVENYTSMLQRGRANAQTTADLELKTARTRLKIEEEILGKKYGEAQRELSDTLDTLSKSTLSLGTSASQSESDLWDLTKSLQEVSDLANELTNLEIDIRANLDGAALDRALSKIDAARANLTPSIEQNFQASRTAVTPDMDGTEDGINAFRSATDQDNITALQEEHTRQLEEFQNFLDTKYGMQLAADEQDRMRLELKAQQEIEMQERVRDNEETIFNTRVGYAQTMASSMSSIMSDLTSSGLVENKKAFKAYQAFAVAETIMSTYQSAQNAFTSLSSIPYVGPVLGAAAAAAAIAGGMARVASIKGQQPAGNYAYGGQIQGQDRGARADNVMINATPGEYMLTRRAASFYGTQTLDKMNQLALPKSNVNSAPGSNIPGFADGGNIGNAPIPKDAFGNVQNASNQQQQDSTSSASDRLNIVNVLDPEVVGDYLSTTSGEEAIVNIVQRNRGVIG